MTLFSYEIFDAVARQGSFNKAAQQLHLTPSAISHAIAVMEEELGFALFNRGKNGVSMTSYGASLYPSIRAVLNSDEALKQSIARLNGLEKGKVKLGAFNSVCASLLPGLLKSFAAQYPQIEIEVYQGTYDDVKEWLRTGQVDIAFLSSTCKEEFNLTELFRILHEVGLTIKKGETHVLMGPNGAGKSTLGYVLAGNPKYSVTEGKILFKGNDITEEAADKRAKAGMFLSFQEPLEVPGLSLESFIRSALSEQGRNKMRVWNFRKELKAAMEVLHMDPSYAGRDLNVGFSGGEKKKSEILQLMMLKPDLAILDETDSGLDVDAVRLASEGIREYQKENPDGALLIITHSTRILDALHVDATHIMVNGHIVASGDASLVDKINREGYEEYEKLAQKGEDER